MAIRVLWMSLTASVLSQRDGFWWHYNYCMFVSKPNDCSSCKVEAQVLLVKCNVHAYKLCPDCFKDSKCPNCQDDGHLQPENIANSNRKTGTDISKSAVETGDNENLDVSGTLLFRPQDRLNQERADVEPNLINNRQQQQRTAFLQKSIMEATFKKNMHTLKLKHEKTKNEYLRNAEARCQETERKKQEEISAIEGKCKIAIQNATEAFAKEKNELVDQHNKVKETLEAEIAQLREELQKSRESEKNASERYSEQLGAVKLKFMEETEKAKQNFKTLKQDIDQKFAEMAGKARQSEATKQRSYAEFELTVKDLKRKANEDSQLIKSLQAQNERLSQAKEITYLQNMKLHEIISEINKKSYRLVGDKRSKPNDNIRDSQQETMSLTKQAKAQLSDLEGLNTKEVHFQSIADKVNEHLIEQFKYLDEFYHNPPPEVIRMTQMILQHYSELIVAIRHPLLVKILEEKEAIVVKYINKSMSLYLSDLKGLQIKEIFTLQSEKGIKVRRIMQRIGLFRSLGRQRFNAALEQSFFKQLCGQLKTAINTHNRKITLTDKAEEKLSLMRDIEDYYEFKAFIQAEFAPFKQICATQIAEIQGTITSVFARQSKILTYLKQNSEFQKLQQYIERAEHLKKFIITTSRCGQFKYFKIKLQHYFGQKVEQLRREIIGILSQNKLFLQKKLEQLMEKRVYEVCFTLEKNVFKKFKIFDQILTKEENHYYNFDFSQLHHVLLSFLKVLKQEKIETANRIITEEKIHAEQLRKEYESISCNVSIKYQFLLKLRIVLKNRTKTLIRMGNLSKLTYQKLQTFREYFDELAEISKDEKMKGLQEITEQRYIFQEKAKAVIIFVEESFLECHENLSKFKDLQQTSKLIDRLLPFQKFLKESFSSKYSFLRKSIISRKYLKLPQEKMLKQYLFEQLQVMSKERHLIVDELTKDQEEPIKDDYMEWYNSIITNLPKSKGKIIEGKMHRSIHQTISELKEKQWAEGDFNSEKERQMLIKVSRMTSCEILAFHELIDFHHKQIMQQRQEIINDQSARLRVAGTKALPEFLQLCQQQEVRKTRFYKVYLGVLQDYVMNSCRNLSTNQKISYVMSLSKLDFDQLTQSIRGIFKTAEESIYFKSLSAEEIKNSLNCIVSTDEKSQESSFVATEKIMDMFKIYAIFKYNKEKSLLDHRQRQLIDEQMTDDKQLVKKFCIDLRERVENEDISEKKCNRRELLLDLIKLEACLRLMNKISQIEIIEGVSDIEKDHEFICQKINTKIDKVYEKFNQFRFYHQRYEESFQTMQFLDQLRELNDSMLIFKQLQYHIDKLEYFIKNNYLQKLQLRKISYKELNRIIAMAWIWEHSKIKKEIMQLVRENNQKETYRYKVILMQKETVKDQDLHSFSFLAKEEYDFKKQLTSELLYIEKTIIKYISELHLENTSYNITMAELKDKRSQFIKIEKQKNRAKYNRHVAELQNSFRQMSNQQQRSRKIQVQMNSLKNQLRDYEQFLMDYDIKQIQSVRASHKKKNQLLIRKMCKSLVIINNILPIFDGEVEMICLNILLKIQQDINEFDKILKEEIIDYSKKRNDPRLKMYFEQDERGEFTDTLIIHSKHNKGEGIDTNLLDDRQSSFLQVMRNCPEIKSHPSLQPQLLDDFTQYQDELERIERTFLQTKSEGFILQVIKDTKYKSRQLRPSILMARIFAVMAIQKYLDLHQEEISLQNLYLTQILAILLLINNPNPERSQIGNRLIKLNPGQGKSRVIAGLNCYLGLKGYEVYCGCLSLQLSMRDQETYRSLYQAFGISDKIIYSQTYTLCEYVFKTKINQKVFDSIRKVLNNERIQEDFPLKLSIIKENDALDRMILVIDQIDGLFDEKYFDKIYSPEIPFQSPELTNLIKFIWKNKNDEKIGTKTRNSQQYERLRETYSHLQELLWNQAESLIVSSQEFSKHPYEIKKDQIVFQKAGEKDRKVNFHFCKIFASCYEYENKNLSKNAYEKVMNIKMKIGEFSYAELPKYFDKIMGFSSTYAVLSNYKKTLIKEDYKMKEVYNIQTPNQKSNQEIVGFHSYYENQYISNLAEHIQKVKKTTRPIIIFFENEAALNSIMNQEQLRAFEKDLYKITQNIPWQLCQYLIASAGKRRRITCTTSEFAKGINFRCDDSKVEQLGGIYVIMTYIPKNQSDFVQLVGRTGRKKEKSSFQMIIKVEDMHQRQVKLHEDEKLNQALIEYWRAFNLKEQERLSESLKISQERQKRTRKYLNTLQSQRENYLNMLVPLNYTYTPSQTIKIIIAVDGTGSTSKCMETTIKSLAKCLKDIWNRTQSCIKQHRINISIEIKIMVFRNYNSRIEKIIQSSNFSRDTIELQSFVSSVKVEGGFGHQAHEVLFFEIGKITSQQKINQIIMIGDSPGNSYRQMLERRKKFFGESYWKSYIPTYSSIQEYSNVLRQKGIPINSLYILKNKKESEEWDTKVKKYYERMSQESSGTCEELRVDKQEPIQRRLIGFVSKRILRIIGEDMVSTYSRLFD